MKNLPTLMDELQKAMAGMSEADRIKSLTEIFGVAAAPDDHETDSRASRRHD